MVSHRQLREFEKLLSANKFFDVAPMRLAVAIVPRKCRRWIMDCPPERVIGEFGFDTSEFSARKLRTLVLWMYSVVIGTHVVNS